ncbi:MAG: hypothetical protein ACFFCO_09470, partial [Promethearchaeota archaeon]
MTVLLSNILFHGLLLAGLVLLYMIPIMVKMSPRVWGFSDYPKTITDHVPPKTKEENLKGLLIMVPFFVMVIGGPLISTIILETLYGGALPLFDAFLNAFGLLMFFNLADYLILDMLIIGTITPRFVIIPGTEHLKETEYKAFRLYHTKGHLKALI